MFRRNSELVVINGEPYLAYKAGTEIDELLDANITTAITKGYELALEEVDKKVKQLGKNFDVNELNPDLRHYYNSALIDLLAYLKEAK